MAGGRRRGTKKTKAKDDMSLGDLVLAKVKGFPLWPAKISSPEDWKKPPDPKKHFVQFYGTEEIAFVAPADIHDFTSEVKNKLLARCQGKSKLFTQAVREISEAFDKLERKNSCDSRTDRDDSEPGSKIQSVNGSEENCEADTKDRIHKMCSDEEVASEDICDSGSKLERCSQRRDSQDLKPTVDGCASGKVSPVFYPEKKDVGQSKKGIAVKSESEEAASVDKQRATLNGQKSKVGAVAMRRSDGGIGGLKKSSSATTSVKDKRSPKSSERPRDGTKNRSTTTAGNKKEFVSKDKMGSEAGDIKTKSAVKVQNQDNGPNDLRRTNEHGEDKNSRRPKRELVHTKANAETDEVSRPAKKSKHVDVVDAKKGFSPGPVVKSDSTRSTSRVKSENHLVSRSHNVVSENVTGDETALPLSKRHRRASESFSNSPNQVSDRSVVKDSARKAEMSGSSNVKGVGTPLQKRRRAVCLYDDDDDEPSKTPVHGGSATMAKALPKVSDSVKSSEANRDKHEKALVGSRDSLEASNSHTQESSVLNGSLSPKKPQAEENEHEGLAKNAENESDNQAQIDEKRCEKEEKLEPELMTPNVAKTILASPKKSPYLTSADKAAGEQFKATKPKAKVSNLVIQNKVLAPSAKVLLSNSSQNQATVQRNRPTSSERPKPTPKSNFRAADPSVYREKSTERGERVEDRSKLQFDSRTPDSASSIRNLIAAAQAKRKQSQAQSFVFEIPDSAFASGGDFHGNTPSPSAIQQFFSGGNNAMAADNIHGSYTSITVGSPSTHANELASQSQPDVEEPAEERRASFENKAAGSSPSGGPDAAIARDAFEGMIETLSRTKESIGRATRLAIDCAKYGISNEVVELLIRKLEIEPSFHRKVDLFFLVDSITQCSHSQKGIAGASYVPTVQAVLPRLIGAVAPAGIAARENRRQCHKVLRLWLERKIFPEALLRRFMEDIGGSNEDTSSGYSLRRPSRSERAVDDPIREMEGMLVDEYGSNATFQMSGFFAAHVFEEEEEDLPSTSKENGHQLVLDPMNVFGETENCATTVNDRRHCILEDVDGELEMEDVSGHQKDEKGALMDDVETTQQQALLSDAVSEPSPNISSELSPEDGYPPLPLDSPPPPPPLPPSLPPPSPSPPPPPPPSSPSPPPPPPSDPSHPPSVPTALLTPQPLPMQSSPQMPLEYGTSSSGNQHLQRAGNSVGNSSKTDAFPPPPPSSPCYVPPPPPPPLPLLPPRKLEHGHSEMYLNPQQNQQFAPSGYMQRALHPPSSHFNYGAHPYHHPPYPMPPPHPDARRLFLPVMPPPADFKPENPRPVWVNGHPPYGGQEGYFRPPFERPPINNMGFGHPAPNSVPAGAPMSGHNAPQMLPGRPDMSSLNCWRPT